MKRTSAPVILVTVLTLVLNGCSPSPSPTSTPLAPTSPTTETPALEGRSVVVTNTDDSGPGSLRHALEDAQPHDVITFDPAIFPPGAPVTIMISSELPHINVRNLTLDASNGGVTLDGSQIPGDWVGGLQIVSAQGVTIMGLQISHFPGPGIAISGDSKHNIIGGDQGIGFGPFGQGNLLSSNAFGIDISTPGSTLNTITGNLIGTRDPDGTVLGNSRSGVSISEGAHGNTIGPHNIIAFNRNCGISIGGNHTIRNRITQNSFSDNGDAGICVGEENNEKVHPPSMSSFNGESGSVSGNSCPDCTIEIFSSHDGEEGSLFEGQGTADSDGFFDITIGEAFTKEAITLSASDADGNTSEFSPPPGLFEVSEDTVILQEGNHSQGFLLFSKPSQLLPGNHIGAWFEDHNRYYDTDFVYRNGFKRIRIGSLAGSGQRWGTIINSDTLSDEVDQTISEYADEGIEIELILASGAGLHAWDTTFQSEEEIEQYLEFVSFVVSHFKGRIQYYEIWNEPGGILVKDYARLVERVVPIIREEDEDAKIIIGAIPGDWVNGYPGYGEYQRFSVYLSYLNELLRSGVVDIVDGISWHPFYDNLPSDPYYQNYPQMFQGIKDLAASQGFTGEYFVDEIMWTTVDEENWDNGPPSSRLIAAKYYTRTIAEHRGLGVKITINTFFQVPFLEPIHNLCDALAGAEPIELPLLVEINASANVRTYTFVLPDGDKLIAIWTNDIAVEDDPGVSATLTLSNFSAQKVVGIDVLNGFEQELITEVENGNLVIRNLLVKDYAIILRFTSASAP